MRPLRLPLLALLSCLTLGCAGEDEPKTEIWEVRAYPSLCDNGVDYQFCMGYQNVETGEYHGIYENIGGLDYEWGYSYRVEVEIREVEFYYDGSTREYELVELIDKQPQPGLEFSIELLLASVDVAQGTGDIGYDHPFTCTPDQCAALEPLLDGVTPVRGVFRFGSSDALFPLELVSFVVEEE